VSQIGLSLGSHSDEYFAWSNKMRKFTNCLVLAVAQVLLATQVWGQATCNIEPKKRQVIESFLCGQASPDKLYQKSGSGCFERSVTQRLEDSAIQIFMFEKCVDSKFSLELQDATIRAIGFMEDLSACINEDVDLSKVMQDRMSYIREKGSNLVCSIHIKSQLYQRRPALEAMIQQNNEINSAAIFKNLGIVIDINGNILDR
jgi:hypothetical protein